MAANYTIFTKFAAIDAMSATLNKIQGRVAAMTTSLNKAQTSTGNVLKGLGDQAIMRGIGLAAIGSGILLKNAIQTAAEFESIKTAISFASGNEAANNLQFLDDTVKNLKIDYLVTAESFKRFLGSMKSTTIAAQGQRDIFNKMATTVRVMGLSAEGQERVFYALGEMYSKGQVMSQELKQQMGNALPGAVDAFAKSIGKPQKEFRKLMESGKIGNEEIKKFVDYIYNVYAPGLTKATSTASASITHLSNTWTRIQEVLGNSIISSGVIDYIQGVMDGVLSWANANRELLKSGFVSFLDAIKVTFQWIYNNWDSIVEGLKTWLGAWAVLKTINVLLEGMQTLLALITLATGPAGIIVGLGLIAAGWLLISQETDTATNSVRTFADEIRETADLWDMAGKYFSAGFGDVVLDFLNTALHWIGRLWSGFIEILRLASKTGLFGDSLDASFKEMQANAATWGSTFDTIYNREIPGSQNISQGSKGVLISKAQTIASKYGMQTSSLWDSGVAKTQTQSDLYNTYSQKQSYNQSQEGLIPNSAYSQSLENKLEVIIKTDSKDTTAEVVKSSGAMPVSVTINNK